MRFEWCDMLSMWFWIGTVFLAALIGGVVAFYVLTQNLHRQERRAPAIAEQRMSKFLLDIPNTRVAAPDFTLEDPAGKEVSLSSLRGKVVFLNFWATWCPPCVKEMPAMEKLHQELGKDGLVVLAVNFQEGPNRVKEFMVEQNLTFAALMDRDRKVTERYQAWALPVSVIIDKRGEIAAKALGARDWAGEESVRFFRELLQSRKGHK